MYSNKVHTLLKYLYILYWEILLESHHLVPGPGLSCGEAVSELQEDGLNLRPCLYLVEEAGSEVRVDVPAIAVLYTVDIPGIA